MKDTVKSRDYKITSKGMLECVRGAEYSSRRALEQMRKPTNNLEEEVKSHVDTAQKILKHAHDMLDLAVANASA